MKKIRITHVITGLSTGGAENVLSQLVERMDGEAFANNVISLTDYGPVARRIQENNVPVSAAGFLAGFHIGPVGKLIAILRQARPHIVQTWMYHGDLIGGIIARSFTRAPVIWNLRQSNFDFHSSKKTTVRIANVCARLSGFLPDAIVCGSNAAYESHIAFGYSPDRLVVLPNGFDTTRFKPDPQCRGTLLRSLDLGDDAFLVGLVARFNPQKDHATFFTAAAKLARDVPRTHFVLCGEGIEPGNPQLAAQIGTHELDARVHLLGLREGLASLYPGLDVLALSSAYGEGAPNVLGEAMACGTLCVATDVGDSALMIGPNGMIVPCSDPGALAAALRCVADMPDVERRRLGERARARIIDEYPIKRVVDRYEALYRRVFSQRYPRAYGVDGQMTEGFGGA